MKILVLTVGGSCAPIVTSIKQNQPDRLVFICSDDLDNNKGSYITVEGEGKVCGKNPKTPDQENILIQANAQSIPYELHKYKAIDNINEMYPDCLTVLNDLRKTYPQATIIADYTGGTKTMSAALACAAMDMGNILISIVKGERNDLIKVLDGTQTVRKLQFNLGFLTRQELIAKKLIAQYDYAAATQLLEELGSLPDIPEEQSKKITRLYTFCKAFDAWDKFNHLDAFHILSPLKSEYLPGLSVVLQSRAILDEELKLDTLEGFKPIKIAHGYELVEDLLLNVERRAHNARYDDAVARLYRAFELLGQLYLKINYHLKTSDINLQKLPDDLKKEYEQKKNNKGKIELGVTQTYALLYKLGDPIGEKYNQSRNKLLDQGLSIRNFSILAHGFRPISQEQYKKVNDSLGGFIRETLKSLTKDKITFVCQFPTTLISELQTTPPTH